MLSTRHELGTQGIAFHIAQHARQVLVLLNGKRLEPTLPDVAAGLVVSVVASNVGRQQPLHPAAEIPVLPRPEHQMKMVRHHAPGEQPHGQPFASLAKQSGKGREIIRLMKHALPSISTVDHVVTESTGQCACRARHSSRLIAAVQSVNRKVECPLFLSAAMSILSSRIGSTASSISRRPTGPGRPTSPTSRRLRAGWGRQKGTFYFVGCFGGRRADSSPVGQKKGTF